MEGSVKDLSKYRFESAKDDLDSAGMLLRDGKFKASVNRSYYAIFHALRSVTALDQFDSSKHSGVIAYFNRTYIKTGIFEKGISKLVDTAFRLREKADYDDFVVISKTQAQEQLEKAEKIIKVIGYYLREKWEE
ncbi:HEPN domain-containing protein [Murimonas intestini]|uniref:HEPN domain-containing protein n=1 Tax=Murimonas intestini TaxID=1337051 RepID=UPI0011DCFA8E|nr:HEPN domain-containing protein [Murimonas intestini]